MKLNACLAGIAILLLIFVFWRMGLLRADRRFWIETAPLILSMVAFIVVNYWLAGADLVNNGVKTAGKLTVNFLPMLITVFLTMGQAIVLVNLYKDNLTEYLGGGKGLIGSLLAAFIMPGSLTSLPIVRDLWDAGASKGPLLVFLLTSPLIGWQIILIRQPMLGWRLTGIQLALATLTSAIITMATWVITKVHG